MSNNYFGDDFNPADLQVNSQLYEPPREGYPSITWHTKLDQHTKYGFWSSERVHFTDGIPQYVNWQEHDIRYGQNPDSPEIPVYITYRLRCVVIGERFRWIVKADDGRSYFYPQFTRKEDRAAGALKSHYQVMVLLPDYPEKPFVIGLPGMVKTMSWDNDPDGKYGNSAFLFGVKQLMAKEAQELTDAARAKKYDGPPIPSMCSLWVDLVPALTEKDGKKTALAINLHGTFCNPFTADLRLKESDDNEAIKTRFVGMDNYKYFQDMRRDIALEWEQEWATASSEEAKSWQRDDETPVVKEDDEIPF